MIQWRQQSRLHPGWSLQTSQVTWCSGIFVTCPLAQGYELTEGLKSRFSDSWKTTVSSGDLCDGKNSCPSSWWPYYLWWWAAPTPAAGCVVFVLLCNKHWNKSACACSLSDMRCWCHSWYADYLVWWSWEGADAVDMRPPQQFLKCNKNLEHIFAAFFVLVLFVWSTFLFLFEWPTCGFLVFVFCFGLVVGILCFVLGSGVSRLHCSPLHLATLPYRTCMMMSTEITVPCEVQPWPRNPWARNEFFRWVLSASPFPTFFC